MKRKELKPIAGLLTAGMLAVTGFVGLPAVLSIPSLESVDVVMEENEGRSSALSDSGNKGEVGAVTKFKSLDEVVNSLEKGAGYKYMKIAGYNKDVLAVTPTDEDDQDDVAGIFFRDGKAYARYVIIYSEVSPGKVVCAGALKTGGSGQVFRIDPKTGVIYSTSHHTFETYFLSPDGSELWHKDFYEDDDLEKYGTCWGYERATNKEEPVERDITLEEYRSLIDKDNAVTQGVVFTVK